MRTTVWPCLLFACVAAVQASEPGCLGSPQARTREICQSIKKHMAWSMAGHAMPSAPHRVLGSNTIAAVYCQLPIRPEDEPYLVEIALESDTDYGGASQHMLRLLGNAGLAHFPPYREQAEAARYEQRLLQRLNLSGKLHCSGLASDERCTATPQAAAQFHEFQRLNADIERAYSRLDPKDWLLAQLRADIVFAQRPDAPESMATQAKLLGVACY